MTYFPKFGPFYIPSADRELYEEHDGHLHVKDPDLDCRRSGRNSSIENQSDQSNPHFSRRQAKEPGWSNLVQDQGNLFYTEPESTTPRNRRKQNGQIVKSQSVNYDHDENEISTGTSAASLYRELKNSKFAPKHRHYDHDDVTGESDSAYGSGHNSRQTSRDKRTAKLHLDINKNKTDVHPNKLTQNDHIRAYSSTEVLNTDLRNSSSKKRNSWSRSSGSYSYSPPVTSGKRKTFYMVPDLQNVSNVVNLSGIILCEKLFGIILCQYKHRTKPNGSNIDQLLRDRKVIVQAVVPNSEAHLCGHIHRGDMLVGLNDIDVTWVNIDDLFRAACSQQRVKLTFQVPQVIGPKQSTPPVTPNSTTPPGPPQLPARSPNYPSLRPPPRPPPPPPPVRSSAQDNGLLPATVHLGETSSSVSALLSRYTFAVMYLTLTGSSEEQIQDVVYQFPRDTNKIIDIRGLFLTLSELMREISAGSAKLSTVEYRGNDIHTCYWREGKDLLVVSLPADKVPDFYVHQILSDLLHNIRLLHGASVSRTFRNHSIHQYLDQLISLTLQRILLRGVDSQMVPITSPLEPALLDTLTGIRWLRLGDHNKILCDEILSEFEAADNTEQEDYDPDERRDFGILGSCLYFKDYLLCSHLFPEDLRDVHLFLKLHSILNLVNKQQVEELVLWREIYPTRLCHSKREDRPGYREPSARWFLLVVVMNHYIMATILEAGSYSRPVIGNPGPDPYFVEQVKVTVSQLDADDANIDTACNERLFVDVTGPALKCVGAGGQSHKNSLSEESLSGAHRLQVVSPTKSDPGSRNRHDAELDRVSLSSPILSSPISDQPVLRRQGSKISYTSNDSGGSSTSTGILKGKSVSQMGSVYDVASLNKGDNCAIKLTRGVGNCLFHYVMFDMCEGVYVSPSRRDMATTQGSLHQHILYNFYNCCLRIHETFRKHRTNQSSTAVEGWDGVREEGVMFTCQVDLDPRKPQSVLMYWVIGRLYPGDKEMYVCVEDGTSQSTLELAFNFNFGLV